MFKEYAKRLEDLSVDVPKVFKHVAQRGAVNFRNEAVRLTDKERKVDIGAYKGAWNAEVIEIGKGEYGIVCMNDMEYASFIEDGYSIEKQHFVPFDKMKGSPKTSALINSFKTKYPNAKGFIAKPRRVKGLKIGKRAFNDTEGAVILYLREEIEIAMAQKKYGLSRSEAKKYLK